MARKWTEDQQRQKRKELWKLYVKQNKTIKEISTILDLKENSVYDRLVRLKISTLRFKKPRYNNIRRIIVPKKHSADLAEFIGILLGDGHLTSTQVTVTLGSKDVYSPYVVSLIQRLFGLVPKRIFTKRNDEVIYFGSTIIVRWLIGMGLAYNKVRAQVDIPAWCFSKRDFIRSAVRGLIDTDGSVCKLKSGQIQISFCNRSIPLLNSTRLMFQKLGFRPSKISGTNIYITRRYDIDRYFREIGFGNIKHKQRFLEFMGGSYSGNYTAL